MHKYNIIYTSPDDDIYLWNGTGFDKLEDEDREVLLYSGKSVKDEQIDEALAAAKAVVKKTFPGDTAMNLKKVEVKVG